MTFLQQATAGTKFTRSTVTLTANAGVTITSSSVGDQRFGGNFILLNASADNPCRIRLYTDSSSMVIDATRAAGNYAINDAVGLITDTVLTNGDLALNFDPPLIGRGITNGEVWYNISSSLAGANVTMTSFPINQPIGFVTGSTLTISNPQVYSGSNGVTGTLTTDLKSFIIYSGSSSHIGRLRLYSANISEIPLAEQTRSFNIPTSGTDKLIADLVFDTASFNYKLVPPLEAYTWNYDTYLQGTGTIGYIMENLSAFATASMNISLVIYQTE